MKTKEEIKQLAKEEYWMFTEQYERGAFVNGYTQCQEDMADVIKDVYLNAYEDGQNNRFLAKENFINSLNKQD